LLAAGPLVRSARAWTYNAQASVSLVPFYDNWGDAQQRWWDIASNRLNNADHYNQFNGWTYTWVPNASGSGEYTTPSFNYNSTPQVTITYDQDPHTSYLVGHVEASHLKPNFAYQLKLVGKPVSGTRR